MLGVFLNSLIWLLAIVIGTFVFWRRMISDLDEDRLWRLMLKILITGGIGGRLGWWIGQVTADGWGLGWLWNFSDFPGFDLWSMVWVSFVTVLYNSRKLKVKVYEIGDVLAEAMGWTMLIISGKYLLINWDQWQKFVVIFTGLSIWYVLKFRYRKLRWYLSGKPGFLWWAGILLIGIGQIVILDFFALGWSYILFLVLYNMLMVGVAMVGIYNLSGRKQGNDWIVIRDRIVSLLGTVSLRKKRFF